MTFEERQQLLRLVIERILVQDDWVRIETIIPTTEEGKLCTHHPERSEGSQSRCFSLWKRETREGFKGWGFYHSP
jgi:hypothetical protein